jgi:hypothetical protein
MWFGVDNTRDIIDKSGERRYMPLPSLSQKAFKATASFFRLVGGGNCI